MNTKDLQKLLILRALNKDETFAKIIAAISEPKNNELFFAMAGELIDRAEKHGYSGNLIAAYIADFVGRDENAAARAAMKNSGGVGEDLRRAFVRDMKILFPLVKKLPGEIFGETLLDDYRPTAINDRQAAVFLRQRVKNAESGEELADAFLTYYSRFGYADLADYDAFIWREGKLNGIEHFAAVSFEDLVGCDKQKNAVIRNTEAFVKGRAANNILLTGARGTGKSSAVKALVGKFSEEGLRLVQITKDELKKLPALMAHLRNFAGKYFIVFIDDLSFEESDADFKYLKSAIEGGANSCPPNVLIYATSNRRHLVRENWQQREGSDIHKNDTADETVSLSDRFGLIIHYFAPTQQEYLAIINHKLKKRGINLSAEELRLKAVQWEMTHSGRNGRIAQEFVTDYLIDT